MYFLFGCRGAKRFYFFILSTRFTDHYHTCRAGTIVFLAYIHGAKVHVFRLRHPNLPIFLRTSLIIIVRYMMAQKSDEVRWLILLELLPFFCLICLRNLFVVAFWTVPAHLSVQEPE